MTLLKRVGIMAVALISLIGTTEMGVPLVFKGAPSVVSTAKAEVGRPLTPVSVAGVARRSARRSAR
jgi:hypothetical protein